MMSFWCQEKDGSIAHACGYSEWPLHMTAFMLR